VALEGVLRLLAQVVLKDAAAGDAVGDLVRDGEWRWLVVWLHGRAVAAWRRRSSIGAIRLMNLGIGWGAVHRRQCSIKESFGTYSYIMYPYFTHANHAASA
jgi:hypothetical protein